MKSEIRLIIKSSCTYGIVNELNLDDFGGVRPGPGDFFIRTIVARGQPQRRVFRVLGLMFETGRIGIFAEALDLSQEASIALLNEW